MSTAAAAAILIVGLGGHAEADPPVDASNGKASIAVSPSQGLASTQDVLVEGSGFPAGHLIRVGECKVYAGRGQEPPKGHPEGGCIVVGESQADADGRFAVSVTVSKTFVHKLPDGSSETLTCEHDCMIEANNFYYTENPAPRRSVFANHPIEFAE